MLHLSFSNRFEFLLDALIARLATERPDPFVAQQVIVPSTGLARRVELALAARTGICANVEFAYPAQWLWRQIRHVVPEVAEESPFAPEVLTWRVFEALGDASFIKDHARLATYLGGADAVMRLDLARRIAQLLEQYITYRPKFSEFWSAGQRAPIAKLEGTATEDEAWQAALWRRIAAELGTSHEHPSATFFRRIEALGADAPRIAGLPHTAHLFCLPALPPLYLEMLRKLARWTELQLYVVNPCEEFWFEIVDPKRLTYLKARGKGEHDEIASTLLASWGKQAQAHIDLLLSGDGELEESGCVFEPAAGASLLAQVQNAILRMEDLAPGSVALAPEDRSLEVHVCHSLTRELEVLYDQLLALFAGPNPPRADEILVVTPDLDEAAPLIDAVFGTAPANRYIPYSITGQPQRRVNLVARAFDALLALAASRHPASEVIGFLQQEPVAKRFGLGPEQVETVHEWVRESGIRWGLDAEERRALDLPASDRHTFADGLHRLYLSYALGDTDACIDGRIGAGNPEGQEAVALGGLWRFTEALRRLRLDWRRPKDAAQWRAAFTAALDQFIAESPDWAEDLRAVRFAIGELAVNMERGGLRTPVPFDAVHAALREQLDDPARGAVPSGTVTFTTLSGLRYLPYRVVCAIGLDDGVFPSAGRALEFDLMAFAPQRGDRQRRTDERNLFLDLLLAARERLYLSTTGRSVRDNSPKPPSVLVAELLDYVVRAAAKDAEGEKAVRKQLTVEHPLQAFAREYFVAGNPEIDSRLVSFNSEHCEALRARSRAQPRAMTTQAAASPARGDEADDEKIREIGRPFFTQPLQPPDAEWRQVTLEQLLRFFANPSHYLLRDRLGVVISRQDEELVDDEPFLPDFPARQAMAERLLPAALRGADPDQLLALARAGNEYPSGALGDAAMADEIRKLNRFAAALNPDLAASVATHSAALSFEIGGEPWRLEGAIGDLRPNGLVRWRYDDTRPRDYLAGWIAHLFLCATLKNPAGWDTRWHSRDGLYRLNACSAAKDRLRELLALYREGLSAPLRFFPKSAWAYAVNAGDRKAAQDCWSSAWEPAYGEDQNPAHRLALRGIEQPLDERFFEIADSVLKPLIAHLDDPRLEQA